MQATMLTLIPLIAPLLLLVFGGAMIFGKSDKKSLGTFHGQNIALVGILIAVVSACLVFFAGTIQSALLGWNGLGFSIRLDSLSVSMLVMISILGYVILRYSENYLDGEHRKHVFFTRLAVTIASVELLILSGNLFQIFVFWVITSICLHSLLVFYRSRPQAVAAARKKYIAARLGDVSLLAAIVCIYQSLGTGDLASIFQTIQLDAFEMDGWLNWATGLLVVTAALKSAQFPTHGWLIEVVETPTPVSALLHAGLLNAGPFLMVRMSYLMIESITGSLMLIVIGGLTALIASVIYMTQPSVKVALGYSSVAHMGFSLLICGFGIYTAAILHVVAHSFYKAHAFLSSGSVVDTIRARRFATPKRRGSLLRIATSFAFSLGVYLLFCLMWGVHPEQNFSLMALGLIIVMGLSQLLAATIDVRGKMRPIILASGLVLLVSTCFFTLEHGARIILGNQIPAVQPQAPMVQWVIGGLLICYSIAILIQLFAPRLRSTGFSYRLGVHLRNGLYANVIFDRLIGSLKHEKFKWANLTVQEEPDEAASMDSVSGKRARKEEVFINN